MGADGDLIHNKPCGVGDDSCVLLVSNVFEIFTDATTHKSSECAIALRIGIVGMSAIEFSVP